MRINEKYPWFMEAKKISRLTKMAVTKKAIIRNEPIGYPNRTFLGSIGSLFFGLTIFKNFV